MLERQELEHALVLIAERVPSLVPGVQRFIDNRSDQSYPRRLLQAECIIKDALNVNDFQLATEESDELVARLATASVFTADEIEDLLTCLAIVRYEREQVVRRARLSVRLNSDEYQQIVDAAHRAGFNTVTDYARSRLLQDGAA